MPKGTIAPQGPAAAFIMPEPLMHIPLDPLCMPSLNPTQAPPRIAQAEPNRNPMLIQASAHLTPITTTHQGKADGQGAAQAEQTAQTGTTAQQDRVQQSSDTSAQPQGHVIGSSPNQQASYLTQQKASLQHDTVVQSNAACQEADLILTEGAYQCLTTTGASGVKLGYRGNWEIPFTVQHKPRQFSEYPKAASNPQLHQQQVLLDTPLPARLLNLREKHEMLYQPVVCQMGCSLFIQLKQQHHSQQEAANAAATKANPAAVDADLQQAEYEDDQMVSDNELARPYSPSDRRLPPMPYSPTQDVPYSPTSHVPYSPTQEAPYYPSQHVPYSPTGDPMEMVHCATGMTENSSLMPLQQSSEASDTVPEAEPMLPAECADTHGGNSQNPDALLFAQPAAQSVAETTQLDTQEAPPADMDTLHNASSAVNGDNEAQAHNATTDSAPDNAHAGDTSAGGAADVAGVGKPSSSQGQVREAGLSYRSYRLGEYSIVTRTPLPLDVVFRATAEVKHAR